MSSLIESLLHVLNIRFTCVLTCLDLLVPALLESEELLGEISILTRPGQTTVSSFADAIQELEKTVTSELEQVDR